MTWWQQNNAWLIGRLRLVVLTGQRHFPGSRALICPDAYKASGLESRIGV